MSSFICSKHFLKKYEIEIDKFPEDKSDQQRLVKLKTNINRYDIY